MKRDIESKEELINRMQGQIEQLIREDFDDLIQFILLTANDQL